MSVSNKSGGGTLFKQLLKLQIEKEDDSPSCDFYKKYCNPFKLSDQKDKSTDNNENCQKNNSSKNIIAQQDESTINMNLNEEDSIFFTHNISDLSNINELSRKISKKMSLNLNKIYLNNLNNTILEKLNENEAETRNVSLNNVDNISQNYGKMNSRNNLNMINLNPDAAENTLANVLDNNSITNTSHNESVGINNNYGKVSMTRRNAVDKISLTSSLDSK